MAEVQLTLQYFFLLHGYVIYLFNKSKDRSMQQKKKKRQLHQEHRDSSYLWFNSN